jgi:hypothetical protein
MDLGVARRLLSNERVSEHTHAEQEREQKQSEYHGDSKIEGRDVFLSDNGGDQRLATRGLSTPPDFIASPLHCFVIPGGSIGREVNPSSLRG